MAIVSPNSAPTKRQATILCIDDELPALQVRTALLESVGYRVLPAMTANAAMGLFVTHEIDLVLSEHMLRDVSGAELSIFMKQVRPDVSVVLLAGAAQLPATLVKQVDACVQKDSPARNLLGCVQEVLAQQSSKKTKDAGTRLQA